MGVAIGFLLVDKKKEKAFHISCHEADLDSTEKSTASTDLYRMTPMCSSRVNVCGLYIR